MTRLPRLVSGPFAGASRRLATAAHPHGTFSNQSRLPSLPVPSLENETIPLLLNTLRPLAWTDAEWKAVNAKAAEFAAPGGIGQELQKRLLKDAEGKRNWLDDLWLHKAYVEYRDSSVLNVSYYLTMLTEPSDYPKELRQEPPAPGTFSDYQVRRAAGWTSLLLDYKELVDSEKLPAEYMDKQKTVPFSMDQYGKFFGGTRVPGDVADTILVPFPAKARHIILMIKDQMYVVDVVGKHGERVPISQIEHLFKHAIEDARVSKLQPAIGQLSTADRDTYYKSYTHLRSLSDRNRKNVDIMNDALFVINLDDYNTGAPLDYGKDEDLEARARQFLHGGPECRNRWVDKSLQFVCANDGRGGVMGEHTPTDGASCNTIVGWVLNQEPAKDPAHVDRSYHLPAPKKLEWDVDAQIAADIGAARTFSAEQIADLESKVCYFDEYGAGWVKAHLKVSPDAFFQMMLQLTWARMYAHPTATYESASTRQFFNGRTETCRTLSVASEQFTRNFGRVPAATSITQLREACAQHIAYMKLATAGKGVDRHLLGLSCQLREGDARPALLDDVVYKRGSKWMLSTSNLSVSDKTMAGFGPVYPDGYGSNYNLQDNWLTASVTARNACKTTNAATFKQVLIESLRDVRKAAEQAEHKAAAKGG
ncbi:acyltransferase ChoActase/COT/CPT [Hyaloraphidium curvatum]|nr:acyltransferase ChoActase/COT/CPT [Hyaloraphidium curvatum]